MITVSTDEDEAELRRFVAERGLTLPVLKDPGGRVAASEYRTTGYPETFVLDREGRLLAARRGPRRVGLGGEARPLPLPARGRPDALIALVSDVPLPLQDRRRPRLRGRGSPPPRPSPPRARARRRARERARATLGSRWARAARRPARRRARPASRRARSGAGSARPPPPSGRAPARSRARLCPPSPRRGARTAGLRRGGPRARGPRRGCGPVEEERRVARDGSSRPGHRVRATARGSACRSTGTPGAPRLFEQADRDPQVVELVRPGERPEGSGEAVALRLDDPRPDRAGPRPDGAARLSAKRADHRRPPGPHHAGLLPRDRRERAAEVHLVVEVHADDRRGHGVRDVRGVETRRRAPPRAGPPRRASCGNARRRRRSAPRSRWGARRGRRGARGARPRPTSRTARARSPSVIARPSTAIRSFTRTRCGDV